MHMESGGKKSQIKANSLIMQLRGLLKKKLIYNKSS